MVGNGRKSMLALAKLAFRCSHMQAKARPSMYEVFKELQELRAEFQGNGGILGDSPDATLQYHENVVFSNLLSSEGSDSSFHAD
jgi:hypothetical protein